MSVTGESALRLEHVDKVIRGFALQEYRLKQICMVQSSNSWSETYYQESATDLTAGANRTVKGIARLAKFPYGEVNFTKKTAYNEKYGMEGIISWEDASTNAVDVIARTLLRISRAVAKAVDGAIYNAITENGSPSTIQTLALTSGYEWDSATVANRDPIQDILNAKKLLAIANYDPDNGNGFLLVSPTDYANILGNSNIRNAGQFYTSDVTRNGQVGKLLGLNVIVSNSVAADKAVVGVALECATWKEAVPLTVVMNEDPGIKYTIRAWEIGVTQLVNPQAIVLITNTQK